MYAEKIDKLDTLIDGAEDLLTRLADAHDPEIQHLRDRVDQAIRNARQAIERQADGTYIGFAAVMNTIDDYVRGYPWLAFVTGVLVAGAVGYVAGATIGAKTPAIR